ncbi:MAG: DUF4197 domain-containing protein [Bacteroidia bacterium]|nr:DUF4197 domain-containing protein [Bacteroidia bacterium]
MKTLSTILLLTIMFSCNAQINFKKLKEVGENTIKIAQPSALTEGEIIEGLKEALKVGAKNSTKAASKPDGFYKNKALFIPFPKEAQSAADKLKELGMEKQVNEFTMTLNRAAEEACKKAAPIFIDAILSMNISDAKGILKGSDTSATHYLRKSTRQQLFNQFAPIIEEALSKVGATKNWESLAGTYNKIPFVKKVNPDLKAYTTNLAIKGLFHLVSKEETKIRNNPAARVSEILKKVFGGNG